MSKNEQHISQLDTSVFKYMNHIPLIYLFIMKFTLLYRPTVFSSSWGAGVKETVLAEM